MVDHGKTPVAIDLIFVQVSRGDNAATVVSLAKPLVCLLKFRRGVSWLLLMSAGWLALRAILSSAKSHRFGSSTELDFERKEFCSSCRGRHPVRGEVHSPEARITSNSWTITPLSSRYLSASALSDHLPRALPTRRTIYPQVVTVSARRFIDRRKRLSTGGWEASPVPFSRKEQNFRSAAADRTRPVFPRQRAGAQ